MTVFGGQIRQITIKYIMSLNGTFLILQRFVTNRPTFFFFFLENITISKNKMPICLYWKLELQWFSVTYTITYIIYILYIGTYHELGHVWWFGFWFFFVKNIRMFATDDCWSTSGCVMSVLRTLGRIYTSRFRRREKLFTSEDAPRFSNIGEKNTTNLLQTYSRDPDDILSSVFSSHV